MSNTSKFPTANTADITLVDLTDLVIDMTRHIDAARFDKAAKRLKEIANIERRSKARSTDFRRDQIAPTRTL